MLLDSKASGVPNPLGEYPTKTMNPKTTTTKVKQRNLTTNLKKLTELYLGLTTTTTTAQGCSENEQVAAVQQLCKFEQMSNWERRPLRQSQMHYAALDAQVLNQIFAVQLKEAQKLGYDLRVNLNIEEIVAETPVAPEKASAQQPE